MMEDSISLEAAIVLSGMSKRTLWRRVSTGAIKKLPEDSRGKAILSLSDVLHVRGVSLSEDDHQLLVRADSGDAVAQADVGMMFHIAGLFDVSVYWLRQAAAQDNADAMQWLGSCHAGGQGVLQDDNLAIMWLARAAALGHEIARQQLWSLMPRRPAPTREGSRPLSA